jgi:hypothetical protein
MIVDDVQDRASRTAGSDTMMARHATIPQMAMVLYSWQECRLCGGAYLLWADPAAPLDTDETGLGERWTEWAHLDGRPYDESDSAACNSCDGLDLESMTAPQRRWGVGLPGSTIAVMHARGLPVPTFGGLRPLTSPPTRTGFVPLTPQVRPEAIPDSPKTPAEVTGASGLSPLRSKAQSGEATFPPGGDEPPPSRAIPFLASLARSITTAPRSSVETYAPREPLELSDPLVWVVMGTAAVTLVAVVFGWFTSPGNVPQ